MILEDYRTRAVIKYNDRKQTAILKVTDNKRIILFKVKNTPVNLNINITSFVGFQ